MGPVTSTGGGSYFILSTSTADLFLAKEFLAHQADGGIQIENGPLTKGPFHFIITACR